MHYSDIPKKMSGEESKLVAGVIVAQREYDLASANLGIAVKRLERYREEQKQKGR